MYGVGLMSGTSLDGVDAALVEIRGCGTDTKVRLLAFLTLEMPEEIKNEIRRECKVETSSSQGICSLNFKLGKLLSKAVGAVCKKAGFSPANLDFVASHGQTIYHIPREKDGLCASTLQIGEPSVIAYEHKVKVVSNFRVMDMAAGGEGAPLVPYTEFLLYRSDKESIALQNIGGIGNVTVLQKGCAIDQVYAFDTGPGNMMIDEACWMFFQKKYDQGGGLAAQGTVNETLLGQLMTHPYFQEGIPKTTGREMFGEEYVRKIVEVYPHIKPYDFIATFTMFTAKSIEDSYRKHIFPKHKIHKVWVGGGGVHNKVLMGHLKSLLPEVEIGSQEEAGYSSDAKEAIAFAVLGNETLHRRPSNVPNGTGAKDYVILGNITPCP